MRDRIYLVGFMGAGKTSVGRLVADRLGWAFVDLDDEIERKEGRSVADIFQDSGEPYFRQIESGLLREVARLSRCVIALGGGTYLDKENRAYIEDTGHSVYLSTPLELIQDRIVADGSRPLFSDAQRIVDLFRERQPSYRMAAKTVDTSDLSPEDIADLVVQLTTE